MLLWRELKKIIVSVPYLLYTAVVILSLYSQGVLDFNDNKLEQPVENGYYGEKNEEIPEIIMPAAIQSLYRAFQGNNYATYPIGFYKNIKLNDTGQTRIAEIISFLTGIHQDEIYQSQGESGKSGTDDFTFSSDDFQSDGDGGFVISTEEQPATSSPLQENQNMEYQNIAVKEDIPYSVFKEQMQKVDDILGGGSSYAEEALIRFGTVPLSYEEALNRYELVISRDKITGGYARLFSDYAVAMVMPVLPVFLAVIMAMKDRNAKMAELVYTRKASGVKVVLTRYAAVVISAMLPVILLSYVSSLTVWGMYEGMELDYLAPLKYDLGWIMPSVLVSAALGMCLTELTNTPVAVALQSLWWFLDVNIGIKSVADGYSLLRLAPRHNAGALSYFRTQDYMEHFQALLTNRLLFTGLALLLIAMTIIFYEAKRRGRLGGSFNITKALAVFHNR